MTATPVVNDWWQSISRQHYDAKISIARVCMCVCVTFVTPSRACLLCASSRASYSCAIFLQFRIQFRCWMLCIVVGSIHSTRRKCTEFHSGLQDLLEYGASKCGLISHKMCNMNSVLRLKNTFSRTSFEEFVAYLLTSNQMVSGCAKQCTWMQNVPFCHLLMYICVFQCESS